MRKLKRFAAIMMASTMMVGLFGMSASADYTPVKGDVAKPVINKYLVMEKNANVPNVTFTYSITAGQTVAGTETTPQILAGVDASNVTFYDKEAYDADNTSKINGTKFEVGDSTSETSNDIVTLSDGYKYAEGSTYVDFSTVSFPKPGVYRYVITEVNSAEDGFTYATNSLYMDVYVINDTTDNTLKVNGYVLHKSTNVPNNTDDGNNDTTEKTTGFVNEYTTNDLTISKTVTGNQGDKNEYFKFTVEIETNTSNAGNKYSVDLTNATSTAIDVEEGTSHVNPAELTVGDDGKVTQVFYLKHNESIIIKGLTASTKYTVTETVAEAEGYTTSNKVNNVESSDEMTTGENNMSTDASVAFENNKQVNTPTGIITTFAPYIIMVALAAFVAFFFLRRRTREF